MLIEVEKLAKAQKFDYLIIESTGISEPIPVEQSNAIVKNLYLQDMDIIENMSYHQT